MVGGRWQSRCRGGKGRPVSNEGERVCAVVLWLWAFGGEREGGLQDRAGVDWTDQDRTGWVCEWIGVGGKGRQFLGRWAADRVGCKGDTEVQEGPSRASIDEVSRKEKKKGAELIMAAAALHVRGPGLRHEFSNSLYLCTVPGTVVDE